MVGAQPSYTSKTCHWAIAGQCVNDWQAIQSISAHNGNRTDDPQQGLDYQPAHAPTTSSHAGLKERTFSNGNEVVSIQQA